MTQKCRPPNRPRPGRQIRRKAPNCAFDRYRKLGKKRLEVRRHAVRRPLLVSQQGAVRWSRSDPESRASRETWIGSRTSAEKTACFPECRVGPAYPPAPKTSARRSCFRRHCGFQSTWRSARLPPPFPESQPIRGSLPYPMGLSPQQLRRDVRFSPFAKK